MAILDNFLLIGLPYTALIVFLVGTIYRYRATKFSYSSLSSQFLEGRQLFWGVVPFHWGILFLFFGHLIAFLIPGSVIAFNSHPLRLLILEISAFGFGLIVLFGLVLLIIRRIANPRLKYITNRMDIVVEVLLIVEVVLGLLVALNKTAYCRRVPDFRINSLFKIGSPVSRSVALPLATLPTGNLELEQKAGA
jgi:nitrate reductase gamma subunit